MNVTLRPPRMTREQFLDWVERQERRYEFDGLRPVAVTGGTRNHSQIIANILFALRIRPGRTPFWALVEAGVAIASGAVRYPDVLVTTSRGSGDDRLNEGAVVIFEIVSPTSVRTDRVIKLREYLAIPSLRRYVVVDQTTAAVSVFEKNPAGTAWAAVALIAGETLELPEIGLQLPIAELYTDVDLPDEPVSA